MLVTLALSKVTPHKVDAYVQTPKKVTKVSHIKTQPTVKEAVKEKSIPPTPKPIPQAEKAPQPVVQPPVPTGGKYDWMSQAGISPADYGAVDYIVTHESGWRYWASEPKTAAYGLCQSLPAYKMASAGADWQTNPVTQLKWCSSYAVERYGSWWGAYNAWVSQRWW